MARGNGILHLDCISQERYVATRGRRRVPTRVTCLHSCLHTHLGWPTHIGGGLVVQLAMSSRWLVASSNSEWSIINLWRMVPAPPWYLRDPVG